MKKRTVTLRKIIDTFVQSINDKNYAMLAAGIAYFSILSFFPLMVTFVAIASLIITPDNIRDATTQIAQFAPPEIVKLFESQLTKQASFVGGNIVAIIVGLLIALIGASGAIENIIRGLNIAYDVRETRNVIRLKLLSLVLTIAGILGGLIVLGLLLINADVFAWIGLSHGSADWLLMVRWPIILLLIVLALGIVYNVAPNRRILHWRWFSWGTIIATILWMLATITFFVYVQHFAKFSQSYGIFASLIMLMMWFNISAYVLLIGAEINHRLEK